MEEVIKGTLMIIGGAEDKKNDCIILNKLIDLANMRKGNIIILTAATEYPERTAKEYINTLKNLGATDIKAIHIQSRQDANNINECREISQASCIYMTGGDQLRITSIMGGTRAQQALYRAFENGAIIAGTSAGASVMSETMITSGNDDDAPKKCTLKMAPGLGLLRDVVIDQHFAQRGRIGRLLTAIAQNPHMLGIGIDEDTGLVISDDSVFEVVGSHAVTVIDGSHSDYSNVSELKPDEILAITNVVMHVLPAGYKYNVRYRKPIT
ncbi:MAG TPA: cyanophycinase [Clostridiales bacterium]|nr:cyanophycinase [Clostridiales bacterium]